MDIYYQKYQKYKMKYLNSKYKNQKGGKSVEKVELYFFKADWCGHCKTFSPLWDILSNDKYFTDKIKFIKLDSEINKKEVTEWEIKGYPTIILKKKDTATEYQNSRDLESIKSFLNKNI